MKTIDDFSERLDSEFGLMASTTCAEVRRLSAH